MGAFGTRLKLEDFETPEKVGGEEVLIPLKNEAKNKITRPQRDKEVMSIALDYSFSEVSLKNNSEVKYVLEKESRAV